MIELGCVPILIALGRSNPLESSKQDCARALSNLSCEVRSAPIRTLFELFGPPVGCTVGLELFVVVVVVVIVTYMQCVPCPGLRDRSVPR